MITKGTENYKRASELANELMRLANVSRRDTSYFDLAFEKLGRALNEVSGTGTFAADIAKTVDSTMNVYGGQVAKLSTKQAWCLACCMVELGIGVK